MPRARVNVNGMAIAKQGYDVDTASIVNMVFSPDFPMLRVAMMGTVTVAPYSGYMSDLYERAIVTFPSAFPLPPIIMVAGQNGDGSTDQTVMAVDSASDISGRAWHQPMYQIVTSTSAFELYVYGNSSTPWTRTKTWKYWVFYNGLEA